MMSDATLERFIKQYIASQTTDEVMFTWHGGEPLLRPIAFYRKALKLQKKFAAGHLIENSIQTNGTLLTPEWCQFLHDNHFLVGISIDGPKEQHDHYRHTASGNSTFYQVMRGIELLRRYKVEFNIMATVNNANVMKPLEFYDFFKRMGCHYIQFTPIVERFSTDHALLHQSSDEGGSLAEFSVDPQLWGEFLCSIYDEWIFLRWAEKKLQEAGVTILTETTVYEVEREGRTIQALQGQSRFGFVRIRLRIGLYGEILMRVRLSELYRKIRMFQWFGLQTRLMRELCLILSL